MFRSKERDRDRDREKDRGDKNHGNGAEAPPSGGEFKQEQNGDPADHDD